MNLEFDGEPALPFLNNILVVEDEFLIREMLCEMLREAHYNVFAASDADEALCILSSVVPDLIITDVRMPGSLDGIELVAKVRETHQNLPIIVTSAHLTQFEDPIHYQTCFLAKPYDFASVIKLIEHELPTTLKLRVQTTSI